MIDFNWDGFDESKFAELKRQIEAGTPADKIDWCGNVRAGVLCFELVARIYYGNSYLDYDCFVGGEPGYSESADGYPYDLAGCGPVATVTEIKKMDYATFQAQTEEIFRKFISDRVGLSYSLEEKAAKPLTEW